jgi:hypothetical protein
VFLALIGWNTFLFTISRDISTDFNIRATGRIRRFFMDYDPAIANYLTWHAHDEPTPWVTRNTSNLRGTTQSILSLLLALIVGLVANLISGNILWSAAIGVTGFIISLIALVSYARKKFKAAKNVAQNTIKFPKTVMKEVGSTGSKEAGAN